MSSVSASTSSVSGAGAGAASVAVASPSAGYKVGSSTAFTAVASPLTGYKFGSAPYIRSKGCNALLSTFGLEEHEKEFTRVMRETYSFLAGGAMLYWWMNDVTSATVPFPADTDLDIWMSIPVLPSSTKMHYVWPTELMLTCYETVLAKAGYKRQSDEERAREIEARRAASMKHKPTGEIEYRTSPMVRVIEKIVNFINPGLGRKIQVIVVKDCSPRDITNTFDLDICKFVAVPGLTLHLDRTGEYEALHTDSLRLLDAVKKVGAPLPMTMRLCNLSKAYLPNVLVRLEKYYGRGFVLEVVPEPCTTCGCAHKAIPITLTLAAAKEYVTAKMS
jgi:hypothetical protein